MLIKSGVPISNALASITETSKSRHFKKALQDMLADIDEGMPLAKVLEKSHIVSAQTLALARLGEQSGNLAKTLQVAAAQEQKQRILGGKIRSALLYPAFVLGITTVVGLGVAWFLLPRLAQTFDSLHVDLPWITQILIGFGDFLRVHGLWFVPSAFAVLAAITFVFFVAPRTRRFGRQALLRVPGIGKLMVEIEITKFGYLLSTMLGSGMGIVDALSLLRHSTEITGYQRLYKNLQNGFENGINFQTSFEKNKQSRKLLPLSVQQIIIAGEKSGSLADSLKNISEAYEEKADATTRNLEAVLEPVLLLIVWAGVLGVAVAVIVPIYSLVGGLGV